MICCEKCFKDGEIIGVIRRINQMGICELCGERDVYIYNTDINNDLAGMFNDLLDIYTANDDLPNDYPDDYKKFLKDELCERWSIFSINSDLVYRAITGICHEKYEEHPEIFDTFIGIMELNQKDYLEEYSILKACEWEDFVEEIKTKNRFHTDCINEDKLLYFFENIPKKYKVGELFSRARICSNSAGFPIEEMGAPPADKATAGRANSAGISCLYLADSDITAIMKLEQAFMIMSQ